MKISSLTDIGNTREMNQDYLYSSEESVGKLPNLFLVADGMGGHKAGEFASRYVVEHIVRSIKGSKEEEAVGILSESIETAIKRICGCTSADAWNGNHDCGGSDSGKDIACGKCR